ncbi:hypothetical protein LCGC14_1663720, partial [marine sediment metagenome]
FLVCKQEQADLGIEFAEFLRTGPDVDPDTGRFVPTQDEAIEQRKLKQTGGELDDNKTG